MALLSVPHVASATMIDGENIYCKNAMNMTAMNMCDGAEFEAEDKKLNAIYNKLMKCVADNAESKPQRDRFIAAEKAWLVFRDADAAAVAGLNGTDDAPGSGHSGDYARTETYVTQQRIHELKDTMKDFCP